MKNAVDRLVEFPHRYKLNKVTGAEDTYDFEPVPGTITAEGDFANRAILMAMQGFIGQTTVFEEDDSITETNSLSEVKTTTFEEDGSIIETFTAGGISIAKQTTFEEDGSITEIIL